MAMWVVVVVVMVMVVVDRSLDLHALARWTRAYVLRRSTWLVQLDPSYQCILSVHENIAG
jgi:hypothetical protein